MMVLVKNNKVKSWGNSENT